MCRRTDDIEASGTLSSTSIIDILARRLPIAMRLPDESSPADGHCSQSDLSPGDPFGDNYAVAGAEKCRGTLPCLAKLPALLLLVDGTGSNGMGVADNVVADGNVRLDGRHLFGAMGLQDQSLLAGLLPAHCGDDRLRVSLQRGNNTLEVDREQSN